MSKPRYYATGGKRFYVIDVLGYAIDPRYSGGGGHASRSATRSYSVLDRDSEMHEEVGIFDTRSGVSERIMRSRAHELAAQLNRATKLSDGVRTVSGVSG